VELQTPAGDEIALLRCNAAEQAVIFDLVRAGDTGGKIQCIQIAAVAPITEYQSPEPFDRNRMAGIIRQLPEQSAGGRIESVDPAVPEIANQEGIGKSAESSRRNC